MEIIGDAGFIAPTPERCFRSDPISFAISFFFNSHASMNRSFCMTSGLSFRVDFIHAMVMV
jgi:hypothetical protein